MTPRLLSLALVAFLSPFVPAQVVQSFVTTTDLAHPLQLQPTQSFIRLDPADANTRPGAHVIVVDDTARFQTMDGFGASITDGTAYLLQQKLSPAARDQVMTKLFSPEHGIGLSFLRQPIGSEDLSRHHFTFDDRPPGSTDPNLAHFAVPVEQDEIFATVKQALRLNPVLTVMATPWSPPAWMKTGDTMNGGELLPADEAVYGRYLTRAVEAFRTAGIRIRYLTVQNEPLNGTPRLASTSMSAVQAARFIGQDLGPDLRHAGLPTQILAYDHNWDHPEYPRSVLADPLAAPFVAGSAFHCYGGTPVEQDQVHDAYPNKGIWMTECSGGTWDREPPLVKTARLLIESTRNWAKAVSLWGIALDQEHGPHDGGCGTCRPLVTVDLTAATPAVSYTGDFYGLAHASRFVAPGAVRIASTSFPTEALRSVAFQNTDGTIALVLLNEGAAEGAVTIQWRGRVLHVRLPKSSLATLTWPGK